MHAFPEGRSLPVAGSGKKPNPLCIALAAYSCRDSRGFGDTPLTAFPFKPLIEAPARSFEPGLARSGARHSEAASRMRELMQVGGERPWECRSSVVHRGFGAIRICRSDGSKVVFSSFVRWGLHPKATRALPCRQAFSSVAVTKESVHEAHFRCRPLRKILYLGVLLSSDPVLRKEQGGCSFSPARVAA
jgi:hypothetical protein